MCNSCRCKVYRARRKRQGAAGRGMEAGAEAPALVHAVQAAAAAAAASGAALWIMPGDADALVDHSQLPCPDPAASSAALAVATAAAAGATVASACVPPAAPLLLPSKLVASPAQQTHQRLRPFQRLLLSLEPPSAAAGSQLLHAQAGGLLGCGAAASTGTSTDAPTHRQLC